MCYLTIVGSKIGFSCPIPHHLWGRCWCLYCPWVITCFCFILATGAWWWPGDVMAASFDCGPCAICPVVSCCHSGHRVRGGANWQQTAPQRVSHQSVSVVHRYMCEVSACQSGTMPQLWAGGLLLIWSRAHSSQLTMTGRLYVVNITFEYTDILLELLYYTVDWTATLWIVVVSSGYSSHFFSCLYTQRNLSLEVGSNYFSLSPPSQPQHDKSSSRFHNFCSSHLPQLTSELSLIMLEWWWLENKMNHAEDQTEMNNYKIHHLAGLDHGRAVLHHRQHLASLPQPSPSPAPGRGCWEENTLPTIVELS